MSAFEKLVTVVPATNGRFVAHVSNGPGCGGSLIAFTNAADLLAWVTRELTPPMTSEEICDAIFSGKTQAVSSLYAAHAAEKANKPSDPSTAPTVAPYEGCWAVLRNGEVFGPLRRDNHPSYPFEYDGEDGYRCWTASGGSLVYRKASPRDIIAVHPSDPRITPETPSDDGWIEITKCPVDQDALVDVEYFGGLADAGVPACRVDWNLVRRYRLSRPSK